MPSDNRAALDFAGSGGPAPGQPAHGPGMGSQGTLAACPHLPPVALLPGRGVAPDRGREVTDAAKGSQLPKEVCRAAGRGWCLHPLKPQGKTPLLRDWPTLATSDLSQLARWEAEDPSCNWGAVTGVKSGFFVVDIDGEIGLDWLRSRIDAGDELPESWAVRTARGLHLYFACSAQFSVRNSVGKIAPNVDVRGEGGYVCIPPSLHPDGPAYAAIDESCPVSAPPKWLVDLLQCQPPITAAKCPERIGALYIGKRNDGLARLGGSLRRKGHTQVEIESELQKANTRRCIPPLEASEVSKIAASVARYPIGGPDPLELAWQAANAGAPYPSRYEEFLSLAGHLQAARPGADIALPLVRIAQLIGVHFTSVQHWRKRAVATGLLTPGPQYIPHRRAGLYRFQAV